MPRRIRILAAFLIASAVASRAGGPAFVAGSGYNAGVEGQPLVWANGSVQYFTDQGNLSPILTGAQADTMIATAFTTWTSLTGVALTASQAGHLAEDVNGSNIETNGEGVVTSPADIAPSATSTPVGIVYDYDGTVTDAILGEGAGDLADCFTNAVYGGPDNFSAAGNIAHALVVEPVEAFGLHAAAFYRSSAGPFELIASRGWPPGSPVNIAANDPLVLHLAGCTDARLSLDVARGTAMVVTLPLIAPPPPRKRSLVPVLVGAATGVAAKVLK